MPKWSAVVSGTPDAAEFGINADHRTMTKFSNVNSEDFKRLSRTLNFMVQKSGPKVEANWTLEARVKQGNQLYYSGAAYELKVVIYCLTGVPPSACKLIYLQACMRASVMVVLEFCSALLL